MEATQFREAAKAVVEDIIQYFTTLPTLPVLPRISPNYLRPHLPTHAPASPEPFTSILSDIQSHILPGLTHWQHPHFFAFFPASTTYPSLLAELYSAAFTAPAFNWLCSPATTELETIVLDWVARALGLPGCFLSDSPNLGGGVIQGSASEAVIVVMCAARERAVRSVLEAEGLLPESADEDDTTKLRREDRAADVRGRLVALGSEQAHSSTQKAATVLGMRYRTVRAGLDTGCRIVAPTLRARLAELRAQGLVPCYLTVCLGTTTTCAVDDFAGIAEVVREERAQGRKLWVHVDAAYAGAVLICPEMRAEACGLSADGVGDKGKGESEVRGMEVFAEFESFDVNMHKWLGVNFDASCLYIRHTPHVTTTLSITPSYLLNPSHLLNKSAPKDYRDYQLPLGRRFRALKIWFVLRCYGISGLQKAVREHVRLGGVFAELCRERGRKEGIEVVSGPAFALTVVRVRAVLAGDGEDGVTMNGLKDTRVGDEGEEPEQESNPPDEINNFGAPVHAARGTKVSDAGNAFTKAVYERINGSGDLFVTSGVVDGIYAIRFVSANIMATEEKWVRRAFEVLVRCIREVRGERKPEKNGHE